MGSLIMLEPGQLFYLMGASGAGKDSLIRYARKHLDKQESIMFAKRYITRCADIEGDGNHIPILPGDFELLLKNDHFAMHWMRHGFQYGISKEIDRWIEKGKSVIINGSRQYFPQALKDYPGMHAILVKADRDLLLQRLQARQRESPAKIKERMEQTNDVIRPENQDKRFTIIKNNDSLEIAGEKFLKILRTHHQDSLRFK